MKKVLVLGVGAQGSAAAKRLDEEAIVSEIVCADYDINAVNTIVEELTIFGTGSAPGLICAATRHSMRYLDTCDTIYYFVWEGAIAKRFQPFWWSPVTALNDMSDMAIAFEGGKFINTPAFGRDLKRQYDYMEEEITFREHCHDEPLHYGFNADTYFKGCKNAYFKYEDEIRSFVEEGMAVDSGRSNFIRHAD